MEYDGEEPEGNAVAEQYMNQPPEPLEEDNPYSEEAMQDRFRNKTTDFRAPIINKIEAASLKRRTKDALTIFINDFFSSTVFMSNLTRPKGTWKEGTIDPKAVAENTFKLRYLELQPSIARTDKNKPELLVILGNIEAHVGFIFTRAVGADREGIINRKLMQETGQNVTTREIINKPARKKSIWGR